MKKTLLPILTLVFTLLAVVFPFNAAGAAPAVADGNYTIQFKVLKDGTSNTSMMDNYTVKPANVKVTNGHAYVNLTLKNSSWITKFQVEKNGAYADAAVVSTNTTANTRVVGFDVADLSSKLNAYTEVIIPAIGYNGKYDVQLEFDPSTLTIIK